MLIEFRVKNFRSIKGEAVLSLVASKDSFLADTNTVPTSIPSMSHLTRSAVIYGANAGGKSNLVRGLDFMRQVVLLSAGLQPQQQFAYQPFRLDVESPKTPTTFETTILIEGVRYQYGFELSAARIESEWLLVYQHPKPQIWFDRKYDSATGQYVYDAGNNLVGSKKLWRESTRPNSLFLSMAVQLNSEQLLPLYKWFAESLNIFLDGGQPPHTISTEMLKSDTAQSRIVGMMNSADISIAAISAQPMKGFSQSVRFDLATGQTQTQTEDADFFMPKFKHTVGEVTAEFDLGDESQGTQKLFAMAGPLFEILERGAILVADELDRSLHPLLVKQIIRVFHDPEINRNGAQLIFTTHDPSQLGAELFRRDQIWFAEKRRDQSSELTPLSGFSPRKGEALGRGYLSGRYGGIPISAARLINEGSLAS